METVSRDQVLETGDIHYAAVLFSETHHDHEIIRDDSGVLRWKENHQATRLLKRVDFNDLVMLFHSLGYDKNSEVFRKLYRDIGYSLSGYWEVFYWDANNPDYLDYKPLTNPK
jgi:hypothetical protein